MNKSFSKLTMTILALLFFACAQQLSRNQDMIDLLSDAETRAFSPQNNFSPEAKLKFYDSSLKTAYSYPDSMNLGFVTARTFLELGNEEQAIEILRNLLQRVGSEFGTFQSKLSLQKELAICYLRLGERINCIRDHSGESCILPIAGRGIHIDKRSSVQAIDLYMDILKEDSSDLESRWLLNIAYMTIGGYPTQVPAKYLIKGLDADTSNTVKPFIDAAVNVGLNTKNMAGGSIIEDFNNDGYLDLVTSSWGLKEGMHYCRNNSDGTFTDVSDSSGLGHLTGGLNMMQTDYNNDGLKDIFVLRGAWKGEFGKEPNSLLRNNGDGTFTDVTVQSGLLSFHPTQTATWADFNNDGWLDVFIGNESSSDVDLNPCELFMNNKDGTFTEVANKAGVNVMAFIKGVTSGDYNNDGRTDLFISTLNGWKILFRNEGVKNGIVEFKDVSIEAGLSKNMARSFPTWFWDYDNDGWLDILVCGYEFQKSLAWYAAQEALNIPLGNSGKIFLFRNNHDGTFTDVSQKLGLNKIAFAMGANFGDIDNDGWLDMYLGTGNPMYQSLVPNKMFKNIGGQRFIDVTTSARVGNLQKGHGVSFADLDYDGDQDIYIEMGGAYVGDAYESSLYINPGQSNYNWINISLEGTTCNKAAIGSKIKVSFKEKGVLRSVYRDLNSGGSFGSNPLMQHIGIGEANSIESIEIKWHGTNTIQTITGVKAGETIKVKQGNNTISKMQLRKVDFTTIRAGLISCGPGAN